MNVCDFERLNPADFSELSLESLRAAGVLKGRYDRLTVLATGELTQAFFVRAHKVTAAAREKIEKAGGKVEILPIAGRINGKKVKVAEASH